MLYKKSLFYKKKKKKKKPLAQRNRATRLRRLCPLLPQRQLEHRLCTSTLQVRHNLLEVSTLSIWLPPLLTASRLGAF